MNWKSMVKIKAPTAPICHNRQRSFANCALNEQLKKITQKAICNLCLFVVLPEDYYFSSARNYAGLEN